MQNKLYFKKSIIIFVTFLFENLILLNFPMNILIQYQIIKILKLLLLNLEKNILLNDIFNNLLDFSKLINLF